MAKITYTAEGRPSVVTVAGLGTWERGETKDVPDNRAAGLLRSGGFEAAKEHDSRPYESRSKDELIELAKARGIAHSGLNKDELITALRS
jgi:hypothetical protein